MKKLIVLFGLGLVFIANAHAARPLPADDAGVVAVGAFEMEYGYEYVDAADKEITTVLSSKPAFPSK